MKVIGTHGPRQGQRGRVLIAGFEMSLIRWADKSTTPYPHRSLNLPKLSEIAA